MQVINTAAKLKVGVFFGGKSIEREVSLNSGRTICDHLDTDKYEVIPLFQDEDGTLYNLPWHFLHRGKIADFQSRLAKEAQKITWDDLRTLVDFVYLAVHGRFAEDGTIQGMLEILNIPYLGSKIFGSALGMNKLVQKEIFSANGIDVAAGITIHKSEIDSLNVNDILLRLEKAGTRLPCIVKPIHEGSSLGVSKVLTEDELIPAIKKAAYVDARRTQDVIIEEKIEGMEFVCVSLQRAVKKNGKTEAEWFTFPITEVVPEGQSIYDYEQKYMPGRATKITPARCSDQDLQKISQICMKASILLNFATISRIDGFLTKDGRVILIDPNTLTGMSPATFLFHQAAEYGMSHTQLINYLIETELKLAGMLEFTGGHSDDDEGDSVETNKHGEKKLRVAVLLGGATNEREISLESGRNICYKLSPQKYDCIPLFVNDLHELYKLDQRLLIKNSTREISNMLDKAQKVSWSALSDICDFVFIGLHGGLGEGGGVQGALEMLGLPYNGSGVLASALCMDKFKTNNFLRAHGFDVPDSFLIPLQAWQEKSIEARNEYIDSNLKDYHYPLILKPHDDGCSVFVKKVKNRGELIGLVDQYFAQSGKSIAMLEELIIGTELTCGVIGNDENVRALVPSNTVAKNDILSIEEKFLPGEGENQTPANLSVNILEFVKNIMVEAYKAVGCAGYSRIDCFYQDENQSKTGKPRVVILEFNTLPGMTPATCIFHQAAECGMRPMDFIDKIIELGFANHAEKLNAKHVKDTKQKDQIPELVLEPVVLGVLDSGSAAVSVKQDDQSTALEYSQEKQHRKKSKSGKTVNFDSAEQSDLPQSQDIDDKITMNLF
ncbi:MAG: ATP-grasp domain-containing protein [Candidatus Babeliales bacterium]|nr:MAG: D-alanine-D-alanine ligase [candidate division TM6 bacterium GW2011_GWF2_36_6]